MVFYSMNGLMPYGFGSEQLTYISFSVFRPLNHPINTSGQVEVCLFSKDDKPAVRKLLETKGIKSITKVSW